MSTQLLFFSILWVAASALTVDNYFCPRNLPRDQYLQVWNYKCYYFYLNRRASYQQAHDICIDNGGMVIAIKSRRAQTFFYEQLKYTYRLFHGTLWIGLSDIESKGKYIWEDGSQTTYNNFDKSFSLEYYKGVLDCVAMDLRTGKWYFWDCLNRSGNQLKSFICEYPLGGPSTSTTFLPTTTTTMTITTTTITTATPQTKTSTSTTTMPQTTRMTTPPPTTSSTTITTATTQPTTTMTTPQLTSTTTTITPAQSTPTTTEQLLIPSTSTTTKPTTRKTETTIPTSTTVSNTSSTKTFDTTESESTTLPVKHTTNITTTTEDKMATASTTTSTTIRTQCPQCNLDCGGGPYTINFIDGCLICQCDNN